MQRCMSLTLPKKPQFARLTKPSKGGFYVITKKKYSWLFSRPIYFEENKWSGNPHSEDKPWIFQGQIRSACYKKRFKECYSMSGKERRNMDIKVYLWKVGETRFGHGKARAMLIFSVPFGMKNVVIPTLLDVTERESSWRSGFSIFNSHMYFNRC